MDVCLISFAAIFSIYVFFSYLLFWFPNILHKRRNIGFVCRHISHRGGSGENYENTMEAFHHAAKTGTEMLELDVQLTKDDQVVVLHDDEMTRLFDSDSKVQDLNYSELPHINEKIPIDFAPGENFSKENGDRSIPLLEDVYKQFPEMPINIDIKQPNELLVKKVSDLTKEYKREHLTVWGNSGSHITQLCYKENDDILKLFCFSRVIILVLQYYSGLLPFLSIEESFLEVFMPLQFFRMTNKQRELQGQAPLPFYLEILARFTNWTIMGTSFINYLERRGIQTYIWVLNSEEDFHEAFSLGATGVMTDYPSLLQNFLKNNPQYSKSLPSFNSGGWFCDKRS